jgi:ATP-binding cassette subfamily B protein/subfamily B ATP-binding cassette protein MsbA
LDCIREARVKYVRRVWPYFRPYLGLSVFAGVVIILSAAVAVAMYWPVVVLIDNVLGEKPPAWFAGWAFKLVGGDKRRLVWFVVIAQLVLVLGEQALNILHNYLTTKLEQYMTLDFRSDLLRHTQRLSIAYHDQKRSGMLIYAINFVAGSAAGLVLTVPPLAQGALTLIGMFVVALKLDWKLALLSLSVVPFLYTSVGFYAKHIQPRLLKVQGLEGESLSIIHEAMSMIKVIVAFGRENHEYGRFRRQGEQAVAARVKLTVRQTVFSLVVTTITAVGTALVIGVGANHVISGTLTVGLLYLFIQYLAQVYRPLEQISYTVGSLQDKLVALQMSFGILDTKADIVDARGAVALQRCRGKVEFRNVGFHYAGRVDTLRDISFIAEPGQVTAVVGPTGAGKSTLVSLIPRFYDAVSGHVLVDGYDTKAVTLASLRAHVSIVLQDPLLFSGTIMENIRYGRLDATDDEVIQAAQLANAHEFVMGLPRQYRTELGERGTQISGGERQRISVARAFLKNAPILILDEPTSSIDSKTEAVILDALDRLMEGRTTFMIAHRLSTIRRAEQILVLDHGQLVQRGTHDELLSKGGLYRQLYEMQTRQRGATDDESEQAALEPWSGAG